MDGRHGTLLRFLNFYENIRIDLQAKVCDGKGIRMPAPTPLTGHPALSSTGQAPSATARKRIVALSFENAHCHDQRPVLCRPG